LKSLSAGLSNNARSTIPPVQSHHPAKRKTKVVILRVAWFSFFGIAKSCK
jgi:hypothetical protein